MRVLQKLLLATGLLLVAVGLLIPAAQAQDAEPPPIETLELTMTLMPEGATLPESVTAIIELPATAAEAARENAARGLDRANAARAGRPELPDNAADAGEQGRERAQQARENAGRGPSDAPGSGGGPPPSAGPPADVPGPPGNPGGPGQGNN